MESGLPGASMGEPVAQLGQAFAAQQHTPGERGPGVPEGGAPAPHHTRDRKPEAWYEAMRRAMTCAPGAVGEAPFQSPSTGTLASINAQYGAGKVTLEMAKQYVRERKKSLARSLAARQQAERAIHAGGASQQQYQQQQQQQQYAQQQQEQAALGEQLMQSANAALQCPAVNAAMMSALSTLLSPPPLPPPLPPPMAVPPVAQQPAKPERRRGPKPELMRWYARMRDILVSGRAVSDAELLQLIAEHVPAGTEYSLAQARAYMASRVYTTTKRKRQPTGGAGGWESSSGEEEEGVGRAAGDVRKPISKSSPAPVQKRDGGSAAADEQAPVQDVAVQPPVPVAGFPGVYIYPKVKGAYYHLVPVGGDAVFMGCHATPAGAQSAYQATLARMDVEVLQQ
jgi:hypothetical protein